MFLIIYLAGVFFMIMSVVMTIADSRVLYVSDALRFLALALARGQAYCSSSSKSLPTMSKISMATPKSLIFAENAKSKHVQVAVHRRQTKRLVRCTPCTHFHPDVCTTCL